MVHVDCFFKVTMKKYILDIQLMNFPKFRNNNTENNFNSYWFNNLTKSFSTINDNLLTCTITYKSDFMPLKRTVRFSLCLKIHRYLIILTLGGHGTKCHVLFLITTLYSSSMATFQFGSWSTDNGFLGRGGFVFWVCRL